MAKRKPAPKPRDRSREMCISMPRPEFLQIVYDWLDSKWNEEPVTLVDVEFEPVHADGTVNIYFRIGMPGADDE